MIIWLSWQWKMKNGKWKMENRPLGALVLRIVLGG
jgi:hypothetical protein